MINIKNKTYKDLFLDYMNNFLTVACFAEYYKMTISQANTAINIGRMQHNKQANINSFLMDNI